MLSTIKQLDKSKEESGFTLVELLVVILIIGILAAIAIPVFLNQRQRANDSAVESDVRNLATNIESALISNPNITFDELDLSYDASPITVVTDGETVTLSDGVVVSNFGPSDENTATPADSAIVANGYVIEAYHENGRQYDNASDALVYDSAQGGIIQSPSSGD